MKAIECRSLVKNFGAPPTRVLRSLSFGVEAGEFMAVTGRSGSGKSTLLYVVSGLDDPTSGDVFITGTNIHGMEKHELHYFRNSRMGFVFQFHYLLPELTSLDNILMPARKFKKEKERREMALSLMDRFEVSPCRDKYPSQMSGGEQQRVAVARALIMEPEILFADEPTGNLDSVSGEKVMKIFEDINVKHGTTILLVTHERDYAARAGRQIHLVDGEIDRDKKSRPARRAKRRV
jgi:putative ABC transport system ATP-binding protein/lipoprotein-releasing system ATP-binding protein